MTAPHHADPAPPHADLTDALAVAILGPAPSAQSEGQHADDAVSALGDPLSLVTRCAEAESITRRFTSEAVATARASGCSWATIGGVLGMSRQAAQQRFGSADDAPLNVTTERWLGPVTAFTEMQELAMAGRLGWHTVKADVLRHRMVRTDTQWEHKRLMWPASLKGHLRDGWQIGCTAFPWVYLIRDTGLPAERD